MVSKENLPIKYNRSYPNGIPYVSIVIATFNKARLLDKTLSSIRANVVDIPYEIIVVDDGSSDNTFAVCKKHSVLYVWVDAPDYRGPSVPRNIGCRVARGEILIMQSDDVFHTSVDTIAQLSDLSRGEVNFASVWNTLDGHNKDVCFCHGEFNPRPLFFLGSMYKDDFWKIGGNDEDFTNPAYEDTYLGEIIRRKYKINWRNDILGLHQNHKRPKNMVQLMEPSRLLYEDKMKNIDLKIKELE